MAIGARSYRTPRLRSICMPLLVTAWGTGSLSVGRNSWDQFGGGSRSKFSTWERSILAWSRVVQPERPRHAITAAIMQQQPSPLIRRGSFVSPRWIGLPQDGITWSMGRTCPGSARKSGGSFPKSAGRVQTSSCRIDNPGVGMRRLRGMAMPLSGMPDCWQRSSQRLPLFLSLPRLPKITDCLRVSLQLSGGGSVQWIGSVRSRCHWERRLDAGYSGSFAPSG